MTRPAKYYREYRAKNKRKILNREQRWRDKNKKKLAKYFREYRARKKKELALGFKKIEYPIHDGRYRKEVERLKQLSTNK